jgi:formate transporter
MAAPIQAGVTIAPPGWAVKKVPKLSAFLTRALLDDRFDKHTFFKEEESMSTEIQIDAFPPAKMAARMEDVGVTKAKLNFPTQATLAILAGAFIACGAIFASTVGAGSIAINNAEGAKVMSTSLPYGVIRLLSGLVFSLGLIAVVVAGAELFTGNNLIVMAFASGKVKLGALLGNWVIVYFGNFVGALLTALVMFFSKQYVMGNGAVGLNVLNTANAKCNLGFVQAIALGIMCNALVCLAVWLCQSARSTTDKILAIVFPISAFVAAGFEHSIANMYFIPIGLLIKGFVPAGSTFWASIGKTAADYQSLTWGAFFLKNLIPVTIGNIIGGAGFVGLVYWFAYLRPQKTVAVPRESKPTILVVDDDPDFVEIIRTVLLKEGYAVRTAASGDQALDAMKMERPSMVLLDVMMTTPLEGVGVAHKMSNDPALREIPVVMISSIDSSKYKDSLPDDLHIPIDAWISKPVDPEHLVRTVRRFIR